MMGQKSIRQEARRAALGAQSKRRRERAEREKRLEDLAVRMLVAVRERDVAVAEADRRAGRALWMPRRTLTPSSRCWTSIWGWTGHICCPRDVSSERYLPDQRAPNTSVGRATPD